MGNGTELAKAGMVHVKDLAQSGMESLVKLMAQPAFQVIGSVALIEFLQTVQIKTGEKGWINSPSGAPMSEWGDIKKPLISQAMATTMETTIMSAAFIEALANSLGQLGGLSAILPFLTGARFEQSSPAPVTIIQSPPEIPAPHIEPIPLPPADTNPPRWV